MGDFEVSSVDPTILDPAALAEGARGGAVGLAAHATSNPKQSTGMADRIRTVGPPDESKILT
jgi:hypothetical protein